jgi:hypothetical protein
MRPQNSVTLYPLLNVCGNQINLRDLLIHIICTVRGRFVKPEAAEIPRAPTALTPLPVGPRRRGWMNRSPRHVRADPATGPGVDFGRGTGPGDAYARGRRLTGRGSGDGQLWRAVSYLDIRSAPG